KKETKASEIPELISKLITDLLSQSQEFKEKIRGIGIAIGGIVDKNRETVRWPELTDKDNMDYSLVTLPLKEMIERKFDYPVCVDNDATMACFGEQWLNQDAQIKDILYMFSGVGCGIMIGGEVYRGTNGCAGEVSVYNSREKNNGDFNCKTAEPCFIKRWQSDIGMVDCAKKSIPSRKDSKIWELCGGVAEKIQLRHIFEAVKLNDDLALDVIKKSAHKLGIKVALLVNIFNPQLVVVGGGLEEAGMPFIEEIRRTVSEWAFEEAFNSVKIIPSRLGENAVALGAANFIVREVFANVKE
ncbi:MAG: ROK family protein, partial [Candidatus Omnitrophica bacterium]|nr:ROK family protein [Candidatus Omnitrophota bacterium]